MNVAVAVAISLLAATAITMFVAVLSMLVMGAGSRRDEAAQAEHQRSRNFFER